MTSPPRGMLPLILKGMLLIARGQARGLNCFRDTPRAFLHSLLPGVGLLVGAVLEGLAEGTGREAITQVPATLCVLLAPAVLSWELARYWGREAFWNRYIVAFNWCQCLLPLIGFLLLIVLGMTREAGLTGQGGLRIMILLLAGYALWMNWFLARHGLALSPWRAAGLVAAVNLGAIAIVLGPSLLAERFG
jgi:hypothetical protein